MFYNLLNKWKAAYQAQPSWIPLVFVSVSCFFNFYATEVLLDVGMCLDN